MSSAQVMSVRSANGHGVGQNSWTNERPESFGEQIMQRRVSKLVAISTSTLLNHHSSFSSSVSVRSLATSSAHPSLRGFAAEGAIPGELSKWNSLGRFRTYSFASGFTPLQRKPLDSIMDLDRVKDRSAEDLASAWDDVIPLSLSRFWKSLSLKTISSANIFLRNWALWSCLGRCNSYVLSFVVSFDHEYWLFLKLSDLLSIFLLSLATSRQLTSCSWKTDGI